MKHLSTALLAVCMTAGSLFAQNDNCASAAPIAGVGSFPFSTVGATNSGSVADCNDTNGASADAWYAWTTGVDTSYKLSVCGGSFDVVIALWDACGGNQLGCEDAIGCSTSFDDVDVTVCGLTPNTTYLIQLDGWQGVTGAGTLDITAVSAIAPPNDNCSNAMPITGTGTFNFDNINACQDGLASCVTINSDVWYEWTAPSTSSYRIATCGGTTLDTVLAVYNTGGACPPSAEIACNDDMCGLQSQVQISATAGTSYLIRLGSFSAVAQDIGTFTISSVVAPPNDDCASATPVGFAGTGTFGFDTNFAGPSGVIGSCNSAAGGSADVWYSWTSGPGSDYQFQVCGGSFDVVISLFDACGGSEIGCEDLTGCSGSVNDVDLNVIGLTPNTPYLIQIDGWNGVEGIGSLTINTITPPANNNCANAIAIAGPGPHAFDNNFSSTDGLPDPACVDINSDVWYLWTAAATGLMQLQTCGGTSLDTSVAVYDNGPCPPAVALGCNDDDCGLQSSAVFNAVAGSQYLVRIGSFSSTTQGSGTFMIDVPPPPPANDDCGNATPIAGVGTFPFTNINAFTDGLGDPSCDKFGTDQVNNDVWFLWTAPASAQYQVETCGLATFDTKLAVYANQACPAMNPLDCNDDTCGLQSTVVFSGVAGSQYLIRVGTFSPAAEGAGNFMISSVGGPITLGTTYCIQSPNSSGNFASITAQGSDSVVAQQLSLNATGLPANVFGIFYYGTNNVQIPFGNGFRCVAGVIQRLPFDQADGTGLLNEPDVFSLPMPNLAISPATLNFQAWFRDPMGGGAGFNLSDGVMITFVP